MSRRCLLCNREFEPRRANQKYCSWDCYRKASNNRFNKRVSDYGNGTIYVLDMNSWTWKKEERKK